MENLHWNIVHFEAITPLQLHQCAKLRQAVFVVEQNCPYLDFDGKDLQSWHLYAQDNQGDVHAYCRILPKELAYANDASIGRVCCSLATRGTGIGRELMQRAIEHARVLYPDETIRISAQSYLERFYGSLGFISTDKRYLEDNIPHVEMYLPSDVR